MAIVLGAISVFGAIILFSAIVGGAIGGLQAFIRFNNEHFFWFVPVFKKLFLGVAFVFMFLWDMVRRPTNLFYLFRFILYGAIVFVAFPFMFIWQIIRGIINLASHPIKYLAGQLPAHSQPPQRRPATSELPAPKN